MTDISSYDRWQIDKDNPCRVVVVHDGPCEWLPSQGDYHTHEIKVYATPEEAAEAVRRFNSHE